MSYSYSYLYSASKSGTEKWKLTLFRPTFKSGTEFTVPVVGLGSAAPTGQSRQSPASTAGASTTIAKKRTTGLLEATAWILLGLQPHVINDL